MTGTLSAIQLLLVLAACVACVVAIVKPHKSREISFAVMIVAFIVSYALGAFYFIFLSQSAIAAIGPALISIVICLSLWGTRLKRSRKIKVKEDPRSG